MGSEKIFFSYSRSDSAFVLKLAKDLRDAGIDLWLDQLDIKPGSHWDSSIQQALNMSHSLIVVLSPTSVASDNVMDEVSFALGNKKTVIPVMLTECSPPFRLMRLQRIDFTGNYQTGLNQLLKTLEFVFGKTEMEEASLSEHQQNKIRSQKEQRDHELERLLWEKAKKNHDLTAYNHYVEEYPDGTYKADALANIKSINEKQKEVPGKSFAKTGMKNKYLLLGGGLVIIFIVIWGIMQVNKKQQSTSVKNQQKQDSIQAAARKATDDSIAKIKKAEAAELFAMDSIKSGNYFRGGIIFYIDQTGKHGLITSQYDQGKDLNWYKEDKVISGAFGVGIFEGQENTRAIVAKMGEGNYPASLCESLNYKGYTDWYLPSKDELNLLYLKRKEVGGFAEKYYWSSSEVSNGDVWYQSFFNGKTYSLIKGNKAYVRAIRKF